MHGHVEVKGKIGGKEGVRFRGMGRKEKVLTSL
jgi:hypothetical protein